MTGDTAGVVIVGGGQGGFQTAASLRQNGYDGRITLVGAEPGLPYQRPPLSKAYLKGEVGPEGLHLRPEAFFTTNRIELIPSTRVTEVAPHERRVTLSPGRTLPYDHLVLATGARNRSLPIPGADLDGVFSLRTTADADPLRDRLGHAGRIAVIGAGFIGLEFVSAALARGAEVHIFEAAERVMGRAVSVETSTFFARHHAAARLSFGAGVTEIVGRNGRAEAVRLADGTEVPVDLVVIGVGVVAETRLAEGAGLAVANGIVVDDHLRTSDHHISAIGDCVAFPCRHAGGRVVRLESVQNAVDQGRCVAARIAGQAAPYDSVPWFWSDQGPCKLQIVGITTGHDRTVRRGSDESFSVFCYAGDRLLGIESMNRPADHMAGRRLLAAGRTVTPEQAGDPGFPLKTLL